jgi:hypothetical protein
MLVFVVNAIYFTRNSKLKLKVQSRKFITTYRIRINTSIYWRMSHAFAKWLSFRLLSSSCIKFYQIGIKSDVFCISK